MTDYVLPKPPATRGYALHRIAEGLTGGGRPLYTDFGDHMVIRTGTPVQATQRAVREVKQGDVVGFELRACVGSKVKGKHRYFPTSDWRSRHQWLARQGERHGFELITVHCTSRMCSITKADCSFTIDQTDFTGVLKVTDEARFKAAVATGIGSKARAFGFGMIHI